jgi:hypothetical protein
MTKDDQTETYGENGDSQWRGYLARVLAMSTTLSYIHFLISENPIVAHPSSITYDQICKETARYPFAGCTLLFLLTFSPLSLKLSIYILRIECYPRDERHTEIGMDMRCNMCHSMLFPFLSPFQLSNAPIISKLGFTMDVTSYTAHRKFLSGCTNCIVVVHIGCAMYFRMTANFFVILVNIITFCGIPDYFFRPTPKFHQQFLAQLLERRYYIIIIIRGNLDKDNAILYYTTDRSLKSSHRISSNGLFAFSLL